MTHVAMIGAMLLVLLLAGAAAAQDVDIQCRVVTDGVGDAPRVVSSQTFGIPSGGDYWNCNVPMPFVVPAGNWVCITDMTSEIRPNQVAPYPRFCMDGHDYHCVPVNHPRSRPMAFPPGAVTVLSVANATGARQWALLTISGFLGQPAGTAREMACR